MIQSFANFTVTFKTDQQNTQISKVYPNPSNGNFYIDYSISNDEQATLSVYNINGHPVYTNSFGGGRGKATINTNNWQTGLYYYTLQQANGSILQRDKIVVIQ